MENNFKSIIRALDEKELLMITEGKFFLFLSETMCCDPSSELSCQDASDEGSQHMCLCRNNKNYFKLSPNAPTFIYPKVLKYWDT